MEDDNRRFSISGGMAEWLKAAVLKTVECQSSVGSNPTPSARNIEPLILPFTLSNN